jgi:hypothetical protein
MAEDGVLPKIQKRVTDFAADERGNISKRSLVTIGGIVAAGATLAGIASQAAAHPVGVAVGGCSGADVHGSVGHGDNVTAPAASPGVQVGHLDSPAYATHCDHGNHSSY